MKSFGRHSVTRSVLVVGLVALGGVACGGGNASGAGANTPSSGDSSSSSSDSSKDSSKDSSNDSSSSASSSGGGDGSVGSPAPDFTVDSVNGRGKVSLRSLAGKVVVVDFGDLVRALQKIVPRLQELNVKYKASGLEIVGISEDDDKGGIADFGSNYGAKFALGWDAAPKKEIAGKFKPKSMPDSFVIDRKGIVRFVHQGYHDGDEAQLEKEIKSLL